MVWVVTPSMKSRSCVMMIISFRHWHARPGFPPDRVPPNRGAGPIPCRPYQSQSRRHSLVEPLDHHVCYGKTDCILGLAATRCAFDTPDVYLLAVRRTAPRAAHQKRTDLFQACRFRIVNADDKSPSIPFPPFRLILHETRVHARYLLAVIYSLAS